LNGELKQEVYLIHPYGFVKKGPKHLVCRLNKALYGLKQAPRSWYVKIDNLFLHNGFFKSQSDPNISIKKDERGNISLIYLYVDDLIIIGSVRGLIEEIKLHTSQ
jgi:ATP-binding cassette subfamily B (MDR/TAP) protein 1